MRLFISYSRKDAARITALHTGLSDDDDLEVLLDTHDIAAAEEWKPRLESLIRSADTILFAVSPSSVTSEMCRWEIDLAESLNKRIVPILVKDVPDAKVPPTINKLNYIPFRRKSEFGAAHHANPTPFKFGKNRVAVFERDGATGCGSL